MNHEKFFIFDTSVVLQAMLSRRSLAYTALRKADNQGIIVVSDATLLELEEKMYLSKFDKYQSLPNRLAFFNAYRLMALNISPLTDVKICRDPNDDMFLSLAKAAGADCLITRDEDLLVLHPFDNIPVLNTSDFMKRFFPN